MKKDVLRSTTVLFAASLVLLLAARAAIFAQSEAIHYDLYAVGVRVGQVSAEPVDSTLSFRVQLINRMNREWDPEILVSQETIEDHPDLRLPRRLKSILSRLSGFSQISWDKLHVVGWPDSARLYEQHRTLLETNAEGRPVHADYWAERGASNPWDFVIGADNHLIAAIDVSNDRVLVRRGYEDFTTLKPWRDPLVSQPTHSILGPFKHMVPMSDGIRLATLVYLPEGEGPFPVVFVRTPYGISNQINRYWHHAARGYALVFQACRGTSYRDPEHRSEGRFDLVINEPADGAAALDWITKQLWSDGNIGMQGGSYVGYTQWAASMADHPSLKLIIPESSMGTVFADQPYMGGGFVTGLAYYLFWMLDTPLLPGRNWTEVLRHRPLIDIDQYATGRDIPQWNTLLENWTNGNYWQRQNWHGRDLARKFATFQTSGWFDDDLPGTRTNWELMQQKGSLPQRLLIGPWRHGTNQDRRLNGFDFGADSLRDDIWLIKQQWYDRFLRGVDNGIDGNRVDYFVLGENQWRQADRWPPPQATEQSWYFHSKGVANETLTDGLLNRDRPQNSEPPEDLLYDPRDPVPNWRSFELMQNWEDIQSYPYDFKDIESRRDVAVYSSEALGSDLTIAGDVRIVLHGSTDAADTDWWAHVSDVSPSGESVRLTVGVLRARFRNRDDPRHGIFGSNFESEELLSGELNDVVRYEITLPPIANTFKKGHRLRIAIMNALDFYTFPNSNTGQDEARVTRTVPAKVRIHHSPVAPSHALLPVLPR